MTRRFLAASAVALLVPVAQASAQSREMYHWRSFQDMASVLHIAGEEGHQVVVEKYGPLVEVENWPVETWIEFNFWGLGVQGFCQLANDAFTIDRHTGVASVDAILSPDNCNWLDGASSVRVEMTWTPDDRRPVRRHYTLLGDTNSTSSEQGWDDRWFFASADGTLTVDGTVFPIPVEESGYTQRTWGHGVIPVFADAFD